MIIKELEIKKELQMKSFTYLGLEFTPIRTLKGKAASYDNISRRISGNELNTPYSWNYNEFYELAKKHGAGKVDIFKVNDKDRIPGTNYLFYYN